VNLADVRTMVRDISDLDTVDLPNALLDTFVKEAFQRIVALERRWPFFQETYTMNTIVDQRPYSIAGIGDIREIISIVETTASGNRFTEIAYDDAEDIWLGNTDVAGRPYFWAVWDAQIHLYPKPDAVYPLTVRAYRNPTYTWLSNTAVRRLIWMAGFMCCWRIMRLPVCINGKRMGRWLRCISGHLRRVWRWLVRI
jgi:hypothetical protein